MSQRWWLISLVLVLGLLLRGWLAWQSPFASDESSYLYDAKVLAAGELPGGDVLAKAPVPAALFAGAYAVMNSWLWSTRVVSVVASMLTVVPLFWLLKTIADKRTAWWGSFLWL